jgi:hypothetical protein
MAEVGWKDPGSPIGSGDRLFEQFEGRSNKKAESRRSRSQIDSEDHPFGLPLIVDMESKMQNKGGFRFKDFLILYV